MLVYQRVDARKRDVKIGPLGLQDVHFLETLRLCQNSELEIVDLHGFTQ